MGVIDTILEASKEVVNLSEKLVGSIDSNQAMTVGKELEKVSKAIKELDIELTHGEKDVSTECQKVKETINSVKSMLKGSYDVTDALLEAFDSDAIINQLNSSVKKNIEALKIGRASSNFGVAGEILRGEI